MKTYILVAFLGLLPLVLLSPIDSSKSSLTDAQESLEAHVFGSELNNAGSTRDKRTIGPLRQIFPNLSQLVDSKIQMITRVLFRVIGRLVLRGGLGGGGGGGGGAGGGNSASSNGSSSSGSNSRRISITLPTYPPSEDDEDEEDEDNDEATNTNTTTEGDSKNQLDGAESQISEVRVPFEGAEEEVEQDQQAAASENAEVEAEEPAAAEDEDVVDEQRDKRFLNFNLGGGGSGAAGGSGGGSGNFLFDIIRLVAGSGNTESSDERANSAVGVANAEQTVEKDDGYQAGVPGPITRLFIIANRGISNLMQDLILRLAQTSERIVNFKARLITSII